MHEVSIMGDVFEIINENIADSGLEKINRVVLRIGDFACVEEGSLRFAFEAFAKDTVVEGAELVIEKVPAAARCEGCGEIFGITFTDKSCPRCGAKSSNIVSGYELQLYEIEGD